MSSIAVIGTGYVGLVSGACLADFGNNVTCVDIDAAKIDRLNRGEIPIFEPGLDDVVARTRKAGRLTFTTDLPAAVQANDVIFIAVGTPPADDGSADLRHVEDAARAIARAMNGHKVIVDKSTVPVGTGRKVAAWVKEELASAGQTTALTWSPTLSFCERVLPSRISLIRTGSSLVPTAPRPGQL